MKRSEMKNKLASYLVKRDEHLNLNKSQALQLAHYTLHFIEKEGMLPPQRTDEEKHYFSNGEKWHTSEFLNYHCRWEDE